MKRFLIVMLTLIATLASFSAFAGGPGHGSTGQGTHVQGENGHGSNGRDS